MQVPIYHAAIARRKTLITRKNNFFEISTRHVVDVARFEMFSQISMEEAIL